MLREIGVPISSQTSVIEGKNKRLKMLATNGAVKQIGEHKVFVVNASIEQSDLGAYLAEQRNENDEYKCDYACIWRYNEQNRVVYVSLRSRERGTDVSKIAQKWNGGGHYCASGFEATLEKFNEFLNGSLLATHNKSGVE